MAGKRGAISRATGLSAALLLGACSVVETAIDNRGQRVEGVQLNEITPGVQTRADIAALLGTPSATTVFGDESWFYVSSVTRSRIARMQAVDEQTVVAVRFDQRGVVQKVETLGLEDAKAIDPVGRTTPTPGNDRNFFQLLFGNIGRFSPGSGQQGSLGN